MQLRTKVPICLCFAAGVHCLVNRPVYNGFTVAVNMANMAC